MIKNFIQTSSGKLLMDNMWKEYPYELALIDSSSPNVTLTSPKEYDPKGRCEFWQKMGLLDYVWVS